MDLKESAALGECVDEHWYYHSKAAAVHRYLAGTEGDRILDVGAGSGFFTKYLLEHSSASTGICVDRGYPRDWEEAWFGKPLLFRRSCDSVEADLVLFMDVLEHVDDDAAFLSEYVAKAAAGARFLVTVPAFQWLWSSHDVFLEHRRRYHIRQLEKTVTNAGLRIVRCSYYFGLVLPLAAIVRLTERVTKSAGREARSQLKQHSWLTNSLLISLCHAELPVLLVNRLAGLSVFCLALKPPRT
jgi:SAM-dependent methyltransferase